MAVTIADLEINIQSTGNEMIATFTRLATKLNALSTHLDKATSSMKKVSKAMSDTGKEAKKAGEGAEKGAKGLGTFANSILRIMKYRAIRAVLKTITQGFREGVQNIALYSAAMNEMDATKANNVMSAYASMGAQIKNSLGAAVIPLLAQVMSMVQKVADMFMDAAEAVAKFFATLNGQTTYTAANREYWVDYAKGLQKSTGAAKELKRTILGFDEINALNSQSSGGSSKTTPNYKDMFVEKTNDWIGLQDTFKTILEIVGAIGIAFATWKISAGLATLLSNLFKFDVKGFSRVLGGIAAIGVGVYFSWEGGKDLATGDIKNGLIQSITGALSTALGGALIGFQVGGAKGALIGAIIGMGVSLVTTGISFALESQAVKRNQEGIEILKRNLALYGYTLEDISDDKIEARANLIVNLSTEYHQIKDNLQDTLTNIEMGKSLIDEIFQFNGKNNLTAKEIARINALCEAFNSLSLGDARIEWKKTTGEITSNREEIESDIEAYKKLIEIKAFEEIAVEAKKNLWKVSREFDTVEQQYKAISRAFTEEAKKNYGVVSDYTKEKYHEIAHQYSQLYHLREEYQADYDSAIKGIYTATYKATETTVAEVGNLFEGVVEETKSAAEDVTNAFDPDKIINPRKWKTAMINAFKGLPSIDFTVSSGKINPHVAGISAYATGGFVPSGDLFIAGEAGAELIMAAPNGSEVVNMAQFERAMMNAVSAAGGQGGDWTIVVQDENGSVKSRQVITAAERANRRDGCTVIPVGVY